MSSNELDRMNGAHILDAEAPCSLENNLQTDARTGSTSRDAGGLMLLSEDDFPPEVARSVKVSPAKRRKVIQSQGLTSSSVRRTRSGGTKPQTGSSTTNPVPAYRSAEQIKQRAKTIRQKRLHETFEQHDNKIRQLFHLTKFVSLVDYNVKTAKEDESEVFKEVRLLPFTSNSA